MKEIRDGGPSRLSSDRRTDSRAPRAEGIVASRFRTRDVGSRIWRRSPATASGASRSGCSRCRAVCERLYVTEARNAGEASQTDERQSLR